jgi:hypothetical protein
MKRFKFCLFTLCLIASTNMLPARGVRSWPYQELMDKADLVVIATPMTNSETKEHINPPDFAGMPVVGIETTFKVSSVIKGDKATPNFVLHYYRPTSWIAADAPTFIYFPISSDPMFIHRTYILFLHRESDGRYASVVGNSDPGLGIRELAGVYDSAVTETQTKLGVDIGNILKECQTIKLGMTRAELGKVFRPEGGLSTARHRTYAFHDCSYVKVDVDFTPFRPQTRHVG